MCEAVEAKGQGYARFQIAGAKGGSQGANGCHSESLLVKGVPLVDPSKRRPVNTSVTANRQKT
jgi:hypothetical protein